MREQREVNMTARANKPTAEDRSDAEMLRQLLQMTGGDASAYGDVPRPVLDFLDTATRQQLRTVLALILVRLATGDT